MPFCTLQRDFHGAGAAPGPAVATASLVPLSGDVVEQWIEIDRYRSILRLEARSRELLGGGELRGGEMREHYALKLFRGPMHDALAHRHGWRILGKRRPTARQQQSVRTSLFPLEAIPRISLSKTGSTLFDLTLQLMAKIGVYGQRRKR